MSKEERYTYHCDQYDYVEIIYDNEECEEIDSMKMAEKRLNRQQDKISDLEAKLAESESCAGMLHHHLTDKAIEIEMLGEEIDELKQQLVEKENTITNLIEDNRASQEWYKKQLAEKEKEYQSFKKIADENVNYLKNRILEETRNYDQDKISFAVEQLEKVKEYIHGKYLDETWHNKIVDEDREDTHEYIDNQIKQLKEMK